MAANPRRVKELFVAALDLPDPRARQAFLERECGADADLRQRLDVLLKAHDDPASALDAPLAGIGSTTASYHGPAEGVGAVIAGRYKLLEQIGEGGMGTVWVAEQTQPVRRKVAVKLIKAGMDSRAVLARFGAERQALALMDHPNIAKVLDGGTTDAGRPFFVMEYVKGVPLTRYCDDARLSIAERLGLFVPVCQAVQHAHQKGVIHRDLKPFNILVCLYDGKPVPKVIDFGLAKAMHQPLTEHTLHTAHGAMLGTPLYMSPEQAEFNNLDVDTRTDVYALGVILYELLTGTTPLEKQRFQKAAWQEMLRLIKEEEPPRPSARLSGSGSLPSVAAQRGLEPVKLTRLVRGELDWIVMKALEKDRSRRYETANGLARDIERHLHDETVEACPPSARYRLGKFARKHRAVLTTAALVALLLALGVTVSTWQAVRATRAEAAALAAAEAEAEQRRLAEERKQLAEDSEKEAIAEKQVALAVRLFLERDLLLQVDATAQAETLRGLGGGFELKENPTIKELLDRAAKALAPGRIEAKFPGQWAVQGSILETVGDCYRGLGEYGKAIEFLARGNKVFREAFGPDNPNTLASLNNLGLAYLEAGRTTAAIEVFEQLREARIKQFGADHPEMLTALHNLALAYREAGQLPRAIDMFEQVYTMKAKKLGAEHPETLLTIKCLAETLRQAERELPRVIALLEELRDVRTRTLGAQHPFTLDALNELAGTYLSAGDLPRAIELMQQIRDARIKQVGANHPDTLIAVNNLGWLYRSAGKWEQALPLFRDTVERLEKRKFQHRAAGMYVDNLSACLEHFQQYTEAETWRRKWLAVRKDQGGADSPSYSGRPYHAQLAELGLNLLKQSKWSEAATVVRECLTLREKAEPDAWTTFNARSMLGEALAGEKNYAEAEPLLLAGYRGMKQRQDKIPPQGKIRLAEAAERLVQLYDAWGKKGAADQWRKKLADERAATKAPEKP